MADTKVSALTALTEEPASLDELVVVDKSDTTQAASGSTKRITAANLYGNRMDRLDGPLFFPEDYGATGDGVADDTTELQACIDAAIAASGTVVLDAATYLVDAAPRTDRTGYSILSLTDAKGSAKTVRIVGAGGMHGDDAYLNGGVVRAKTIIKTTRTTDDYSATYGPPSVLGIATEEQGAFTTTPKRYIGPVTLQHFAVQVPLDPAIAGIDLLTAGGALVEEVNVVAGTGGDAVAAPTKEHAFGFRWPNNWNNVYNRSVAAHAYQMYAGHVWWEGAGHVGESMWAMRCVIAYGFENSATVDSALRFVYAWAGSCKYVISGWSPTTGPIDVPVNTWLSQSTLQTDAGGAPFAMVESIKDANNFLRGELAWTYFNAINVGSTTPATGAQKLRLLLSRETTPNVASAATLTVPPYANVIKVTGTTTITSITASYAKRQIALMFTSTAEVTDGGNLKLQGNFLGAANRVLTLFCDGTDWWESGRSYNNASEMPARPHTFSVGGEIKVPAGDTDYIPGFFVPVPAGQTAKVVKCFHRINSGTSVTAKLQKNGTDLTGFTGISVTTTSTTTDPTDQSLADGDRIDLVVTAVSTTPKNLSFTVVIEYGFA